MSGIYCANKENIVKASEIIKSGGLVAFPTETVYGLGASVFDAKAVANIFKVKGRPQFNPLISHIASSDMIKEYAIADDRALFLASMYWPGPITFVLNRKDENPAMDLVCAGLKTMTVRCPNHSVALDLIKHSGVPIAAPSANRSQTISPTDAMAVYESLGDSVDMILDGGDCKIGVESTIIDLTTSKVVLLRAGGITKEMLEETLNEKVEISDGNPDKPNSPVSY
jgi:L-threonylcarbamoyladenylate synthase